MATRKPSRKALQNATKGALRNLTLAPFDIHSKDYVFPSLGVYYLPERGEALVVAIPVREWKRWHDIVAKYYDSRISTQILKQKLAAIFSAWSGVTPESSSVIDEQALALLDELDRVDQHEYLLLIPLEGLSFSGRNSLPLATVEFMPGSEASKLAEQINYWASKYPDDRPGVPLDATFVQMTIGGDTNTFREQGLPRLEDALAIVRTMALSRSGAQYQIGVAVEPHHGSQSVFWEQADTGYHGHTEQLVRGLHPLALDEEGIRILTAHGLPKFNTAFADPTSPFSQSKIQAVRWFSSGIVATRAAEAFVAFMVAIEALLSTGRQSKEVLGDRVAALLVQSEDRLLEPGSLAIPMRVSTEFYKTIHNQSLSPRRQAVKKRFVELYNIRNSIVHDGTTDERIGQLDVLDVETMSRAVISTVVAGAWTDEKSFMSWLKGQTGRERGIARVLRWARELFPN